MSDDLRVVHTTTYHYRSPVELGPHRLMLRPRDGHDMWVEDAFLTIHPEPELRWFFDAFGNSVAEATFSMPTDRLEIRSELLLSRYVGWHIDLHDSTVINSLPFRYSKAEEIDLLPYLWRKSSRSGPALDRWLETCFSERPETARNFLIKLSDAIHDSFDYSARDEMGTHTPSQLIRLGSGTCRDFAYLLIMAARRFGFAARFVTGYLQSYNADEDMVGAGATHAWTEVFLPDEGWLSLDPTNRIVESAALIRVATTREPDQASPVWGSYAGRRNAFKKMEIEVTVEVLNNSTEFRGQYT
jgi:transglutaminase-like putative cysteine protease